MTRICPLKQTYSHTRFRLSIRTKDAPTIYHRLLLFRINKPTLDLGEDGDVSAEQSAERWEAPELYCMEETCPHLGAPLSHAQMEDIEDSMAIGRHSRSRESVRVAEITSLPMASVRLW